jgi:predicted enzyme related to lactoylglutathione lyase
MASRLCDALAVEQFRDRPALTPRLTGGTLTGKEILQMIKGGNATVYVSDFEAAIGFYTKTLGLKLRFRAGMNWAEVDAGDGFVIGVHPATPHAPKPGTQGAIQIGLNVVEPLDAVVKRLTKAGVVFTSGLIDGGDAGRFVSLGDLDGNSIYLWQSKVHAAKA